MPSLADSIMGGIFPDRADLSISDKMIEFFSRFSMGEGSPEGVIAAYIGSQYVDIETGDVWKKTSDDGEDTGWEQSGGSGDADTVQQNLDDHIADATGAHAASAVSNTPAGNIAATNVQTALNELDTEKAPLASPVFTGNPTAPTPATSDNDNSIATTAMVQAAISAFIAANNVQVFKGVIDCSGNPNYPAADAGAYYVISVAGKIGGASGVNVEAGDSMLCLTDSTASGDQATVGANWKIFQVNIDGAVTGPVSATADHFAQFNGATGKIIKGGISLDVDGTLAANSDTRLASQKAVKTYADTKLANTLVDAKGDLLTATADNTPARLAVGSNTLVLEADSSAGTGLAWKGDKEVLMIALGDESTVITTGTAKVTFRMPFAMTLSSVRASLTTVSSSGLPTFDIKESGSTILSTALTIDANEKTSTTAATAAVISDPNLADDAEITIDITTAGTGATGAKIYLIGRRA